MDIILRIDVKYGITGVLPTFNGCGVYLDCMIKTIVLNKWLLNLN